MDKGPSKQTRADHDLLISIETKQDRLILDVANLTTTVMTDVATLKLGKLDKEDFEKWRKEDYDATKADVKQLRAYAYMAIGVIGFLNLFSLVLGIYAYLHR